MWKLAAHKAEHVNVSVQLDCWKIIHYIRFHVGKSAIMSLTTETKTATETFQAVAIEAALRDALISNVQDQDTIYGVELPTSLADASKQSVSIDSLIVVEILCAVEYLVGSELPQKLVKEGGYESIDQAVKNLMPKIEKVWQKNRKGKVKS